MKVKHGLFGAAIFFSRWIRYTDPFYLFNRPAAESELDLNVNCGVSYLSTCKRLDKYCWNIFKDE